MIPIITKEQMKKIDDLAVKHFGIEIIQMMENAGRNTAAMARDMLKGVMGKEIVSLAGKGNNGGDAIVATRFLHNWGAKVTLIISDHPDNLKPLIQKQNSILKSMNVPTLYPTDAMKFETVFKTADLIIDGLFGYNINRNPEGVYKTLIELANNSARPILAIDIPSGLDPDTGKPFTSCIKAKATLALTLPKKGCLEKEGKEYAGEVYVADIGIPPELYELMGLETGKIFEDKEIVKF